MTIWEFIATGWNKKAWLGHLWRWPCYVAPAPAVQTQTCDECVPQGFHGRISAGSRHARFFHTAARGALSPRLRTALNSGAGQGRAMGDVQLLRAIPT